MEYMEKLGNTRVQDSTLHSTFPHLIQRKAGKGKRTLSKNPTPKEKPQQT